MFDFIWNISGSNTATHCEYKRKEDAIQFSIIECSYKEGEIINFQDFDGMRLESLDVGAISSIEITNHEEKNCNCQYAEFADVMVTRGTLVTMTNCSHKDLQQKCTFATKRQPLKCYISNRTLSGAAETKNPDLVSDDGSTYLSRCSSDSQSCVTERTGIFYKKYCSPYNCSQILERHACSECLHCCETDNCNENTIKENFSGYYSIKVEFKIPKVYYNDFRNGKYSFLYDTIHNMTETVELNLVFHDRLMSECNNSTCLVKGILTTTFPREMPLYIYTRYYFLDWQNRSDVIDFTWHQPTYLCLEDGMWPTVQYNLQRENYTYIVNQPISCVGGSRNAFRKCILNKYKGSYWENEVEFSSCILSTTAAPVPKNKNESISDLLNRTLTIDNVEITGEELLNFTNDVSKLNDEDIDNGLRLTENILEFSKKLNNTKSITQLVTNILSNVMDVEPSKITGQKLQTISKTFTKTENVLFEVLRRQTNGSYSKTTSHNLAYFVLVENNLSLDDKTTFSVMKSSQVDISINNFSNTRMEIPNYLNRTNATYINFSAKRKSLFYPTKENEKIGSMILTGQYGPEPLWNLEPRVYMWFQTNRTVNKVMNCSYWDEHNLSWSSEGCSEFNRTEFSLTCSCNHLTSFATLFFLDERTERDPFTILSFITYVGLTASIFCLIATIATYCHLKQLRKEIPGKILICMALAFLFSSSWFLISSIYSVVTTKEKENQQFCKAIGFILHWSYLSSMCWCSVNSFLLYKMCIVILGWYINNLMKKCCLIAWGFPVIVPSIIMALSREYYGSINGLCWITNDKVLIVGFYIPLGLMLIFNTVVFVLMIRKIYRRNRIHNQGNPYQQRTGQHLHKARSVMAMSVIMGIGWLVGFFLTKDLGLFTEIFEVIFVIINSFQGVYLFIFFCLLKPEMISRCKHCFYPEKRYVLTQNQRRYTTTTTMTGDLPMELQ